MYRKKIYGASKKDNCPFCQKQAFFKNKQGLIVCKDHKKSILPDIKCVCGSYLELKTGKFGPYFNCINCGNVNIKKGVEILNLKKESKKNNKDEFILDPGKYPGFDYGIE